MPSLDLLIQRPNHIIAQIIETEFVVSSIGDIAEIGFLSCYIVHGREDASNSKSKKLIDLPHPLTIALG